MRMRSACSSLKLTASGKSSKGLTTHVLPSGATVLVLTYSNVELHIATAISPNA